MQRLESTKVSAVHCDADSQDQSQEHCAPWMSYKPLSIYSTFAIQLCLAGAASCIRVVESFESKIRNLLTLTVVSRMAPIVLSHPHVLPYPGISCCEEPAKRDYCATQRSCCGTSLFLRSFAFFTCFPPVSAIFSRVWRFSVTSAFCQSAALRPLCAQNCA